MGNKRYRQSSVYAAAKARMRLVFEHFERVCVAFSGGKDSSVTLHLALEVARETGKGPVHALFIDLEGQYQATIAHVAAMFNDENVRPWWICLPINLRNASSLAEPYWCAWDKARESDWIRPMPQHPAVISDPAYFPFYRHRMEFEEFAPAFNEWLAQDIPTAFLVGIRSDESLTRYLAIKRRGRSKKRAWTPPQSGSPVAWSSRDAPDSAAVAFFPIYDWKFADIWRYIGEHGLPYNRIYDQMYQAGIPFSHMRICQPYGDEQRKGLDLFHRLEPETWFRIVQRVSGANYGARYSRQPFLGYRGGMGLPPAFSSWRQYSDFLLNSMPSPLQDVYTRRIRHFIQWWSTHGYPLTDWPDAGTPAQENRRTQPSWRRVAMSLLKQDMARSLSFSFSRADKEKLVPPPALLEAGSPP
ncbi:Co-activator of prophage gene expression IbrA [plant metagenome]|uniref:Co-activator of prophage gene expression IbrA n=1 Tax=plant metagenome TaxID=1297885 RepID=A0A484NTQ8_9ZZZZ